MNLNQKINIVKDILKDKNPIIAFSGGADSTLIGYLASKVAKDPLAITINNNLMSSDFISSSQKIASFIGIKQLIVKIDFYKYGEFLENKANRCYICREIMYNKIKEIAIKKSYSIIVDGTNITDLLEDRPGILINYKNNILSPFVKAGITSKDVHEYLNKNHIKYAKSTTCIGTRIPTNTKIEKSKINNISSCEDLILKNTKCEIVKLRDFEDIAICEVDDISSLLNEDTLKLINDKLKGKGYKKVALNLTNIKENTQIELDYADSEFTYKLPYNINIKDSEKEFASNVKKSTNNKITLKNNVTIYKNGYIKGKGFEDKKESEESFINILPYLRRTID